MQTRHSKTALLAPLMCKNPYVPEWDWPPQSGLVNSPWVCSSGESRHRWECSRPQCRDLWGTSRCSPRSPPPHWRSGWSLPLHLHVRGDHVQITLQTINVLLVDVLWSPRSPPPHWRSGWSPSPPPPRQRRSCSDYPAIHQSMISRNVMTNMVNPIRIRIELAVMDPDLDPYWECGSGSRSMNID